jgi:hypothetical protein
MNLTTRLFLVFICFAALAVIPARGQITLDHSYTGWASVANLDISGYKYYVLDVQNETLKLYNTNHSLWKSVNLSVPAGYQLMTAVYNVSENLFSLDGKVGFTYSYHTTSPDYQVETRVINENGTVLLTVSDANYAWVVKVEEDAKLLAYITNSTTNATTTKVYDLPGELTTEVVNVPSESLLPFPNPAINVLTIPYPSDEMTEGGEIRVFNSGGQLMKSYQVDNTFDYIIIRPGTLSAGAYHYKVLNSTGELDAGSFVVQ